VQATETHSGYSMEVTLPGVHADDVRIEVRGRRILITGRKALDPKRSVRNALSVFDGGFFGPLPIAFGTSSSLFSAAVSNESFATSCPLPEGADTSTARAQLADGLLHITFRKRVP